MNWIVKNLFFFFFYRPTHNNKKKYENVFFILFFVSCWISSYFRGWHYIWNCCWKKFFRLSCLERSKINFYFFWKMKNLNFKKNKKNWINKNYFLFQICRFLLLNLQLMNYVGKILCQRLECLLNSMRLEMEKFACKQTTLWKLWWVKIVCGWIFGHLHKILINQRKNILLWFGVGFVFFKKIKNFIMLIC